MKLYIAMIASVIAISGCKKDEDSGAADAGDDTCVVTAETCAAFSTHYLTCADADADYAADLLTYEDEGCADTYTDWVAAGCCG